VLWHAATDHHHLTAARVDLGARVPQASHLLAAEDSAEVADEAEHHGSRVPEETEGNGPTALVERGERSEAAREVIAHGDHTI